MATHRRAILNIRSARHRAGTWGRVLALAGAFDIFVLGVTALALDARPPVLLWLAWFAAGGCVATAAWYLGYVDAIRDQHESQMRCRHVRVLYDLHGMTRACEDCGARLVVERWSRQRDRPSSDGVSA